jgi:uncharacterized membrane-anchored protein YhcB (DUF1043 family)
MERKRWLEMLYTQLQSRLFLIVLAVVVSLVIGGIVQRMHGVSVKAQQTFAREMGR